MDDTDPRHRIVRSFPDARDARDFVRAAEDAGVAAEEIEILPTGSGSTGRRRARDRKVVAHLRNALLAGAGVGLVVGAALGAILYFALSLDGNAAWATPLALALGCAAIGALIAPVMASAQTDKGEATIALAGTGPVEVVVRISDPETGERLAEELDRVAPERAEPG